MWAVIVLACVAGFPCYPIEVLALVKSESLCEEIIGLEWERLEEDQALICMESPIEQPDEKT